jgi:hypothetical protein
MKSRKLSIAFSATCVIASLLLFALWARSNRTLDYLQWNRTRYGLGIAVTSFHSRCEFTFTSYNEVWRNMKAGWTSKTTRNPRWSWPKNPPLGFGISSNDAGNHFFMVPHWFLILITGFLAASPWIPKRFAFRVLLTVGSFLAAALVLALTAGRM